MDNTAEASKYSELRSSLLEALNKQEVNVSLPTNDEIVRFYSIGDALDLLYWNTNEMIYTHYHSDKVARPISMLNEYLALKKTTLQTVSEKHGITRERVRQLINRIKRKNRITFYRLFKKNDEAANYFQNEFWALINEVIDTLPAFIYFSSKELCTKTLEAVFYLFFDDEVEDAFNKALKFYTPIFKALEKTKTVRTTAPLPKKTRNSWDYLNEKIFYGTLMIEDSLVPKETYVADFEHKAYIRFKNLLEALEGEISFTVNPNIVYYVSKTTTHRPDFMIHTKDGRYVLVITCPTLNMALWYNQKRFNALHKFCTQNGYGYLIVDDKLNSVYDIKKFEVKPELEAALNSILDKKGGILWSDILELRSSFKITAIHIAAYIIQNNLYLNINPYMIRKTFPKP